MSCKEIVVDVVNLSKRYEIYTTPRDRLKQLILPRLHRVTNGAGVVLGITKHHNTPSYFSEFWALKDVSIQVRRGESFGIIGRNGSGKSTLLQIIAGILSHSNGEVSVCGRVAALLELGSGFNPEFTGRENVYLNGRILGLTQKEIASRYDQIVDFADIGEFIDQPVKTYSSGMFLRLAFAVQAHIDASIIIIDEALAVGDVFFRQKCYSRLEELRNQGAAILLVSHSMPDIEQYCERAILLNNGEPEFIGSSSEAARHYYLLHQENTQAADMSTNTPSEPQETTGAATKNRRPPERAFVDLSNKSQIGNGLARCIGVALCNSEGKPCTNFNQGDLAVFYYEFEIDGDIGIPICGLIISNDRGIIVHGKNSWQASELSPSYITANTIISCKQEVELNIGHGDYVYEIGLSSVSSDDWENRGNISHEQMSAREMRICHLSGVGSFSVKLGTINGVSVLTHHGIANLPGRITMGTVSKR